MLGDNNTLCKKQQAEREREREIEGRVSRDLKEMRHGLYAYLGEEPSRWNSKWKGPDAGACLPCLWNSKEVTV